MASSGLPPASVGQPVHTPSTPRTKVTKQLTGKRDDTVLHSAARSGDIAAIRDILDNAKHGELAELLSMQNSAGETSLFVAAEYGYYELVRELIQHYDLSTAAIKAKNGFDALHIAAKQGDIGAHKTFPLHCLEFSSVAWMTLISSCRSGESAVGGSSRAVDDS